LAEYPFTLDPPFDLYKTTSHDPAEQAFREYEHERWEEAPERWSPLINLEQLAARPNLEIEWFCPDWIPVGAKTILSAEPKTGKTILLFHILKAVTEGGKFLGKQCPPTRVLYLTEQTEQEFKKQVCEVKGLIGNKNFFVLLAEETPQEIKTWEDTIAFAEKMLSLTKSKILVVDTFGGLAKLPPHGENDAATIQNQINKLNPLFKNRYLGIILTHHNRKKSENPQQNGSNLAISSARGSSAFVGGGGHLIFMDAPNAYSTKRDFTFYGRYLHGKSKTLNLTPNGYESVDLNFGGTRT
jgi:RecA-family ATPase